ncbi:hypothetical protein HCN44_010428, partial [Aphidius gifuensis]
FFSVPSDAAVKSPQYFMAWLSQTIFIKKNKKKKKITYPNSRYYSRRKKYIFTIVMALNLMLKYLRSWIRIKCKACIYVSKWDTQNQRVCLKKYKSKHTNSMNQFNSMEYHELKIKQSTELMFNRRKKNKANDFEAELIKKMNQRLRKNQLYIHKVGLLGWLSHGFHVNRQINDPNVLGSAMSLVPIAICPDGRIDLKYLEQYTKWFKKLMKIEFNKEEVPITSDMLLDRLNKKVVHNYRELVLVYIATLRGIGINCRLVISLCPPPMKLRREQLFSSNKKQEDADKSKDKKKKLHTKKSKDLKNDNSKKSNGKIVPENSQQRDRSAKEEAKQKAVELLRSRFSRPVDNKNKKSIKDIDKIVKKIPTKKDESDDDDDDDDDIKSPPKVRQLRSKAIQLPKATKTSKKNTNKKTNDDDKNKEPDVEKIAEKKNTNLNNSISIMSDSGDSSSDEDVKEIKPTIKKPNKIIESIKKNSRRSSVDRRIFSSDDEEDSQGFMEKFDVRDSRYMWVEVYVESEENWISVSVPDGKIHCVSEIYKKIPVPVLYIIGFNSLGYIKDLTRRYAPHWLTSTRKKRIDDTWWSESLSPYWERRDTISIAEDEMLLQKELEQPLPTTLSECKGHPLYVIQKHLLKFEALYPPDCVPLGYLKTGDAIYSRHCVHTLRSRETWTKQARVVKPKQEPYKIVKAMPKYDKMTGQRVSDLPLELFGQWQTSPYVPPEAKDGKVPRNEYGNVDLFQQSMLPKGTVHIDLPGLNKVARKLGIDCSPAVVGFNFGCRGALPAFEGFVVCEEFEETLRQAWDEEQIEAEKRANEKREKRIWGNWRKLIRGLLIREHLAEKYDFAGTKDKDIEAIEDTPSCSSTSTKRTKTNSKQPAKKIKKA